MNYFIYSTILLLTACYSNEQSRENKVIHNYNRRVIINKTDTLTIPKLGRYTHVNNIPPRYQWESNSGYCGEISLKSAGLYYGQYVSQFDVRNIICGKDQTNCELLLGVNVKNAAHKLKLKYKTKQSKDSKNFLRWVKEHVLLGYPVIIGVMNNEHI